MRRTNHFIKLPAVAVKTFPVAIFIGGNDVLITTFLFVFTKIDKSVDQAHSFLFY
jgi:hypothetical protein